MWWWLPLACQAPFGADRHDLTGFRIAAVSVVPEGALVVAPRVAVVVDGRPWSQEPLDLRWGWVAEPSEVADAVVDEASSPEPALTVPEDRRTLVLVARAGDEERRAFVEVPEDLVAADPITTLQTGELPLAVADVEGPELLVDARDALADAPARAVPPGGFLRLRAEVAGDPLIRWMATAGTFFELDHQTADWAAGDLRLDEDEIDEDVGRTLADAGPVTFLALGLSEPAVTTFAAADRFVGDEPVCLWVGDRCVLADEPLVGLVRGTLLADDASPTGLRLDGAALVTEEPVLLGPDLCGAPLPFDPNLLLRARCARSEVIGATVELLAREAP